MSRCGGEQEVNFGCHEFGPMRHLSGDVKSTFLSGATVSDRSLMHSHKLEIHHEMASKAWSARDF